MWKIIKFIFYILAFYALYKTFIAGYRNRIIQKHEREKKKQNNSIEYTDYEEIE